MTKSDVVNNLTTTTTNVPLSAAQGKVLNDKYNSIGNATLLGSVGSNQSSTSASITLSQSLDNFKYVLLKLDADGYEDVKMFPVSILSTKGNLSGRGYHLKVYATDSYYCEVNVGFYNKTSCEVRTVKYAGWTGMVYVYGVK